MKMKMLLSLAFLLPNDVVDAFENILFSDAAKPVVSYFEDTYIGRKQRVRRKISDVKYQRMEYSRSGN